MKDKKENFIKQKKEVILNMEKILNQEIYPHLSQAHGIRENWEDDWLSNINENWENRWHIVFWDEKS